MHSDPDQTIPASHAGRSRSSHSASRVVARRSASGKAQPGRDAVGGFGTSGPCTAPGRALTVGLGSRWCGKADRGDDTPVPGAFVAVLSSATTFSHCID